MKGRHSRLTCLKLLSSVAFLVFSWSIFGQNIIKVVDEKGSTLIGVEVYTDEFDFATVTDVEGKVSIPAEFSDRNINFKYLGFQNFALRLSVSVESSYREIQMIAQNQILDEVILVGRSDIRSRDFLQKIDAVTDRDIALSNPQTSVDALARNADVYVQKSQMGGGSPVIRGFEANKVLLVVDGVRMNNAIYRNGHLQNAITVDNSVLDQMEVIYGPSSLMYGSDALGGVIHFRTKDPVLNLDKARSANVFGNYMARYGSANQEKTLHADVNIGLAKWGSLTSISFSDFQDLRAGSWRTSKYPDYGKRFQYQSYEGEPTDKWPEATDTILDNPNPNILRATGYSQLDILQKLRYQINDKMNLTANLQYSTSSDIPRYDQLILPDGDAFEFAEWYYGPQKRGLASLKYKWTAERSWMNEMVVIASTQDIEESRIERQFGNPLRRTGIEKVRVHGLTIDQTKYFGSSRKHTIYYGADMNLNIVSSTANQENITNGETSTNVFTRYPSGGSKMNIFGAYLQYVNQSKDSTLVLHGGLRFSNFSTSVEYLDSDPIQWPSYFYEGIQSNNSSLSWSAGINWQPTNEWTVRLLTASAFRAPNVDDIGKLRINNNNVLVPNTNLGAENSINGEINISRSFGFKSIVSATFFYTRLMDAIVRVNFMLPDGSTTFTDGDRTYNVEGNVNADQAEIYGSSFNVKFQIFRDLDFSSSINYTRGRLITNEASPLAHIPPIYGRTQLRYKWNDWDFTLLSQYNGKKPIAQYGGSADNVEYATPEGALSWAIVNAYVDYSWNKYNFQLGLENILDKHYIPFASGVAGPGFNLIIAVRGKF